MNMIMFLFTAFGDEWKNTTTKTVKNVNVTLGSFVLLPCNPPASNPPPLVEWMYNSVPVDTSDAKKYKLLPSGDLIIRNVYNDDVKDDYHCRVTNVNIFGSSESLVFYRLRLVGK